MAHSVPPVGPRQAAPVGPDRDRLLEFLNRRIEFAHAEVDHSVVVEFLLGRHREDPGTENLCMLNLLWV